jgi:uncharacterized protein (TIGR00369 family)
VEGSSETPLLSETEAQRLLDSCEIHRLLGIELIEWALGDVLFRFTPPGFARAAGASAVHGGALLTALDTAACFAAISSVGADCSTVDLRTDFLRPALSEVFTVRGTTLRAGKSFAWGEANISSDDRRVVAVARGLFVW